MIPDDSLEILATFFRAISQPTRLQILLAIGTGEACVCHLEAATGQRQAYISQQLMGLREAGIVESHREGRNIYYRMANPQLLELIQFAGKISNQEGPAIPVSAPQNMGGDCPCPRCDSEGLHQKQEDNNCISISQNFDLSANLND